MLKLIFNKDNEFFSEKKIWSHLGDHLKKVTPNSDLQLILKESGNSMTTAKCQTVATLAPVFSVYRQ